MDRTAEQPRPPIARGAPARLPPAGFLYAAEGLSSVGGNLMQVGIFFYTARLFGWGTRENFTLAAAQGLVYVVGALLAHGLTSRFGPRKLLAAVYAAITAAALSILLLDSAAALVAALLVYTALMAVSWPILESLVATGVEAHALSRRISVYNVIWAGTGAATLAVNGAIIDFWPAGIFVITAVAHGLCAALILLDGVTHARPHGAAGLSAAEDVALPPAHVEPEPELLHFRTLALWLSRVSMPASYALIYALAALLPSLPPMKAIPTWAATLVASTWLASRFLTFVVLGLGTWWHTRPRALLAAAWLMFAAFAAVGWQPADDAGPDALAINLAWLVICQVVIGIALGLIYSASLYFGMVLSEGSTEHSGYHEALIGLGSVLGPGAGALAQWVRPGQVTPGVIAVAGVLLASTVLATGASVVAERRRE